MAAIPIELWRFVNLLDSSRPPKPRPLDALLISRQFLSSMCRDRTRCDIAQEAAKSSIFGNSRSGTIIARLEVIVAKPPKDDWSRHYDLIL
jgi:hypothetical protein